MPIARIFYTVILALVSGGAYIYAANIFVPFYPKRRIPVLTVCFILAFLSQMVLNLVPPEICMDPQYEWFYVFAEIGGAVALSIGSAESVWIGYGKMMELSMIRNILTSLMQGGMAGLFHKVSEVSAVQSFTEYQCIMSTIFVYILLYPILQFFRRHNLFGRIPCLFWEMVMIISMGLTVVDIMQKLMGDSGMSMSNGSLTFYMVGIIPFTSASVVLFLNLRHARQKENEQIEKTISGQYAYYQNLRDYQLRIREVRHDLVNHIEAFHYMKDHAEMADEQREKQYVEHLLERLNIRL